MSLLVISATPQPDEVLPWPTECASCALFRHCAAPSCLGESRGSASRWCRPWGRCMPAISRWCGRPAGARGGSWSRSSSIPRSLPRMRILATYPRTFDTDVAALAEMAVDLVWAPTVAVMYPRGFATPHRPGGAGHGRARGQVSPAFFRRGRDRGGQALDPMHARLRDVRREGLSAAQGGHAAGAGPRSAGEDRRRADRARARRPRAVLTQRVPVGKRARGRPRAPPALKECAGQDRARRAASRACSTKAAPRSSAQASRSTISKPATPKPCSRSLRSRKARSACWRRAHRQDAADRQHRGVTATSSPSADP